MKTVKEIPFVETLLATSSHHKEERRSKLRLYSYLLCPALNRFTYNRTAPGTPAGNCRKKA
jgi:hypothetical protein